MGVFESFSLIINVTLLDYYINPLIVVETLSLDKEKGKERMMANNIDKMLHKYNSLMHLFILLI